MKETPEEFVQKLEPELEGLPKGALQPGVNFREIQGWSSMHALIVMAFADTQYDVSITGEELRGCNTVQDLFQLIGGKAGKTS